MTKTELLKFTDNDPDLASWCAIFFAELREWHDALAADRYNKKEYIAESMLFQLERKITEFDWQITQQHLKTITQNPTMEEKLKNLEARIHLLEKDKQPSNDDDMRSM